MRRIGTALPFGYCVICGDPAGIIYHGTQVCGIECLKKWRSGVKTKPICPICKGESLYRDGACYVCSNCKHKCVYPTRVEVKDHDAKCKD